MDKYFTPELSDFIVGYEFEENAASIYDNTPSPTWYKRVFKEPFSQGYIIGSAIKKGFVRVPYLTKEQIEAEGWIFVDIYRDGGTSIFKKGNWDLEFYATNKISGSLNILVSSREESGNFYGECKDINTFRYICKLLNIK